MPNYDPIIPGPRPPKRKPKPSAAAKIQRPYRRPNKVTGSAPSWAPRPSAARPRPLPPRRGQGQVDDMGPYRKPAPAGKSKPSGRRGATPMPKRTPRKKTGFYGQRPVGRGKFGR